MSTQPQYVACWDEYCRLGDTPDGAVSSLIELDLEPWADNRADDERSTQLYQVFVCRPIWHRWGDVRDEQRWCDMDDAPNYYDGEALVYEAGARLERVEVALTYNEATEEWEATR